MVDVLQPAFEEKRAIAISHALSIGIRADVEHRTKDMVALNDLEVLTEKTEAALQKESAA